MSEHTAITRGSALGLLGAASLTPVVAAGAPAREKLTVAVGAEHALAYLPWDIAKALGYFEAEGLDVTLIYTKGGSEAGQALVSGSVDYSGNAIDHAIAAQQQGKSLLMIADFMHTPALTLLVRPADKDKFTSVKDLKGRTVGISTVGAATHVIGMWVAHKAGLARDDVKFFGIGTGPTFVAGLQGGQVDAAWGTDPFVTKLIREGRAVPMLDLFQPSPARAATGFSEYTFTGALTRPDVIQKKPETTQKVINALVRAQKFMSQRAAMQIARALPEEYRAGISPEDWAPGYSHSRPAYTDHGTVTADGVRAVMETNAYFLNASTANLDINKLFDNSFVERAHKSVKV